jgi:urease accessory protein UreF
MFKKIGIGLAIAAVVAAVGVGVVLAQEPTPTVETPAETPGPVGPHGGRGMRGGPHGGLLEVVAEALKMTVDELREALADGQTVAELAEAKGVALEDIAVALVAAHAEYLQQAVESGRLTQEEADAKLAEMEANILERLESGELVGPGGPGGPGRPGVPGGPRGGHFGAPFDVVAEALGMTVDDLREALVGGQTIAELVEAKGVALEDIAVALVAAHAEYLQQAVESGRLTQEEADAKLAEMEANILERLESGELVGPGGPGGRGGPAGMGGGPRGGGFRGPRNPDGEVPVPEE